MQKNPFEQFETWYQVAKKDDPETCDVMALATADKKAAPSVRMVLYKGLNQDGFLIYTNYESRKAQELAENPQAALAFYWHKSYRQVRVEGRVKKISYEDSNQYFQSRPRDSQLSAAASPQSRVIMQRDEIEKQRRKIEKQFENTVIPCPEFWGGYCLIPTVFEFWQGRESRFHDRFHYIKKNNEWLIECLAP